QLAPIRSPFTRQIFGGSALRNEAFPSAGQGSLVQRAAIAGDLFADAQDWRTGFRKELFKKRAALGEWSIAQICLTVTKDVEGDEGDGRVRRVRRVRTAPSADFLQVNASLEVLKASRLSAIVQGDDFTIEHHSLATARAPR